MARSFEYGPERYDAEVFEWLTRPRGSALPNALDDTERNGLRAWIYQDAGHPIGFGALGPVSLRFPAEDRSVDYLEVAYVGVRLPCRGRGYLHAILPDLLEKARWLTRDASVFLFVDVTNTRAAATYKRPPYNAKELAHDDPPGYDTLYITLPGREQKPWFI